MFSEVSKSKYSCSVCKKQYTRKLSLERHTILCDLKTRSKVDLQVEEEEVNLARQIFDMGPSVCHHIFRVGHLEGDVPFANKRHAVLVIGHAVCHLYV